jgi:ribonuclease HI
VVAGLEAAADLGLDRVELRTDSRLVVRHLGDSARPLRNPALAELRDRALAAAAHVEAVRYRWVPAELNGRADALVGDLRV